MIDMSMPADGYLVDRLTNTIICGYCHIAKDSDEHIDGVTCFLNEDLESGKITRDDLAFCPDYYSDDTLILEESFVEATSISKEDEWAGIFSLRDRDFIGRYDDVEPNRCTHATTWWTNNQHGKYTDNHLPQPMKIRDKRTGERTITSFTETDSYVTTSDNLDFEDPRLMRLEFNELQGFISSRLIDLGITEKFHAKVYNVFVGNYDSKLHVGSCTLSQTIDGRIQAKCSKCNNSLVAPHNSELTRSLMEDFIHAVIRHGNNHGPDFITKRSDFTFIHASNCDTAHDHSEFCNANQPRITHEGLSTELTASEVLDFLIDHRKFCTSSDCRCTHYYHLLSELERQAA